MRLRRRTASLKHKLGNFTGSLMSAEYLRLNLIRLWKTPLALISVESKHYNPNIIYQLNLIKQTLPPPVIVSTLDPLADHHQHHLHR